MLSPLSVRKFIIQKDQQSDRLGRVQLAGVATTLLLARRAHLFSFSTVLLSYTILYLFYLVSFLPQRRKPKSRKEGLHFFLSSVTRTCKTRMDQKGDFNSTIDSFLSLWGMVTIGDSLRQCPFYSVSARNQNPHSAR